MAVNVQQELDPTFAKALGYFCSKSPDAVDKLKEMLEEAIAQSNRRKVEVKGVGGITKSIAKPGLKPKTYSVIEQKKKEKELSQKRDFDKIKKDLEDLNNPSSGKKIKLDSPLSVSDSTTTSSDAKNVNTTGDEEKNFDLDPDDIPCAVCNKVAPDSNGNKPVECQECHNFFHQDCHQPPISDQDASDPRCVWYCARCTKNMKKMAKQSNIATSKEPHGKVTTVDPKNKVANMTPFKRHEVKTSLSSNNNAHSGSLSGWAALSGKPISGGTTVKSPTSVKKEPPKSSKGPKIAPKQGPKLAVSDAWAEALGAKVPVGSKSPGGSKSWSGGSGKSSGKHSSTSGKSSMFPKAAATSVPVKSRQKDEGPMKRLQMVKKKAAAKLQQKRNK